LAGAGLRESVGRLSVMVIFACCVLYKGAIVPVKT
jgi:hypothetical protein